MTFFLEMLTVEERHQADLDILMYGKCMLFVAGDDVSHIPCHNWLLLPGTIVKDEK